MEDTPLHKRKKPNGTPGQYEILRQNKGTRTYGRSSQIIKRSDEDCDIDKMFENNYLRSTKKIRSDEKTQNEANMNLTASVLTMCTVKAKTKMVIEKQDRPYAHKTDKQIKQDKMSIQAKRDENFKRSSDQSDMNYFEDKQSHEDKKSQLTDEANSEATLKTNQIFQSKFFYNSQLDVSDTQEQILTTEGVDDANDNGAPIKQHIFLEDNTHIFSNNQAEKPYQIKSEGQSDSDQLKYNKLFYHFDQSDHISRKSNLSRESKNNEPINEIKSFDNLNILKNDLLNTQKQKIAKNILSSRIFQEHDNHQLIRNKSIASQRKNTNHSNNSLLACNNSGSYKQYISQRGNSPKYGYVHQHNGQNRSSTNIVVGGMCFEEEEVIEENIIIEESSNDEKRFGSKSSAGNQVQGGKASIVAPFQINELRIGNLAEKVQHHQTAYTNPIQSQRLTERTSYDLTRDYHTHFDTGRRCSANQPSDQSSEFYHMPFFPEYKNKNNFELGQNLQYQPKQFENDEIDIESQNMNNRNILKDLNKKYQEYSNSDDGNNYRKKLKRLDDIPAEQYDYDASYDMEHYQYSQNFSQDIENQTINQNRVQKINSDEINQQKMSRHGNNTKESHDVYFLSQQMENRIKSQYNDEESQRDEQIIDEQIILSTNNNMINNKEISAVSDYGDLPNSNDIPLINFYPSEERDGDSNLQDQEENQNQEDIDNSQFSSLMQNQQPYSQQANKNSGKTERTQIKEKLCNVINIGGETESYDEQMNTNGFQIDLENRNRQRYNNEYRENQQDQLNLIKQVKLNHNNSLTNENVNSSNTQQTFGLQQNQQQAMTNTFNSQANEKDEEDIVNVINLEDDIDNSSDQNQLLDIQTLNREKEKERKVCRHKMFKEDRKEAQNAEQLELMHISNGLNHSGRLGSSECQFWIREKVIERTESSFDNQRLNMGCNPSYFIADDNNGGSIGFQQQISQNYTVSIEDEIQEEIKVEVESNDASNRSGSYFDLQSKNNSIPMHSITNSVCNQLLTNGQYQIQEGNERESNAENKSYRSKVSIKSNKKSSKQSHPPHGVRFSYFAASSLSDDRWLCPICLDIFQDAVETPCCHNLFCEGCISQTTQCPLCNQRIIGQLKPNIPIRRLVTELSINCPNSDCNQVLKIGEIDKHLNQCLYTQVQCPNNAECGKMIRKNLRKHTTDECHYRIVNCLLECGQMLQLNQMDDHIQNMCKKFEIQCLNHCGANISRGRMQDHVSKHCPLEIIDCPNKGESLFEEGCCMRLKRREMESHKVVCCYRKLQCQNQGCQQVIFQKDLQFHDDRCLNKIIECDNKCGHKIQRQNLDQHRDMCLFQLVRCPYYDLGCKIEILRKDYKNHLLEESFNHSIIFIEGQKRKNFEIDDLKLDIANLRKDYDVEIKTMFLELNRVKNQFSSFKQSYIPQDNNSPAKQYCFEINNEHHMQKQQNSSLQFEAGHSHSSQLLPPKTEENKINFIKNQRLKPMIGLGNNRINNYHHENSRMLGPNPHIQRFGNPKNKPQFQNQQNNQISTFQHQSSVLRDSAHSSGYPLGPMGFDVRIQNMKQSNYLKNLNMNSLSNHTNNGSARGSGSAVIMCSTTNNNLNQNALSSQLMSSQNQMVNLSYSVAGLSKSSQDNKQLIHEESKEQIPRKNSGASRVSSNSYGSANRNDEFRETAQEIQNFDNELTNRESACGLLQHIGRPPTSYKPQRRKPNDLNIKIQAKKVSNLNHLNFQNQNPLASGIGNEKLATSSPSRSHSNSSRNEMSKTMKNKRNKYNDLTLNSQGYKRNSKQFMDLVRLQQNKNKAQLKNLDEINDNESLDLDKYYDNISNNFIIKSKTESNKNKINEIKVNQELLEETKQSQFESGRKRNNDVDRDEDKDTYSIISNSIQDWAENKAEENSNYEHSRVNMQDKANKFINRSIEVIFNDSIKQRSRSKDSKEQGYEQQSLGLQENSLQRSQSNLYSRTSSQKVIERNSRTSQVDDNNRVAAIKKASSDNTDYQDEIPDSQPKNLQEKQNDNAGNTGTNSGGSGGNNYLAIFEEEKKDNTINNRQSQNYDVDSENVLYDEDQWEIDQKSNHMLDHPYSNKNFDQFQNDIFQNKDEFFADWEDNDKNSESKEGDMHRMSKYRFMKDLKLHHDMRQRNHDLLVQRNAKNLWTMAKLKVVTAKEKMLTSNLQLRPSPGPLAATQNERGALQTTSDRMKLKDLFGLNENSEEQSNSQKGGQTTNQKTLAEQSYSSRKAQESKPEQGVEPGQNKKGSQDQDHFEHDFDDSFDINQNN